MELKEEEILQKEIDDELKRDEINKECKFCNSAEGLVETCLSGEIDTVDGYACRKCNQFCVGTDFIQDAVNLLELRKLSKVSVEDFIRIRDGIIQRQEKTVQEEERKKRRLEGERLDSNLEDLFRQYYHVKKNDN